MEDFVRIPPQALDLEASVLGACLIEDSYRNIVIESLVLDDFYSPAHKLIYETILDLHDTGDRVDILIVEQALRDRKKLDVVGGPGFIVDLTHNASLGDNVKVHCNIIRDKTIKRSLIRLCNESVSDAYDSDKNADRVLDDTQEKMFALRKNDSGTTYSIGESLNTVIETIQDIQDSGNRLGIETGLDIDKLTMGFEDAKYYVIAARPSMGKTALVIDIMKRIAKKDYSSAILSLETSHDSLTFRFLTSESKISTEKLKTPGLSESDFKKVIQSANTIGNHNIYLDDTLSLSDQQMRAKIRSIVQRYSVSIVFIDFLQLLSADAGSREQEITKISRAIKVSCKECSIPVVAISQLSRATERRTDKRPTLSDLRESGSIEQDADVVMFLYRPEYYGIEEYPDGASTKNVTEIIVAKNKDGRTGTKKLLFLKDEMRFYNFSNLDRTQRKSQSTDEEEGASDYYNGAGDDDKSLPF